MSLDELQAAVADTAGSLAAKTQAAVIDNRPDDAAAWSEALANACHAYQALTTLLDDD